VIKVPPDAALVIGEVLAAGDGSIEASGQRNTIPRDILSPLAGSAFAADHALRIKAFQRVEAR